MPSIFDLLDSVSHMMTMPIEKSGSKFTELSDAAITAIEDLSKHKVVRQSLFDGYGYTCNFDNGYGISIIKHSGSYGGTDDQFEVAVLKGDRICYTTPITNDVLGWLTEDEVVFAAKKVAALGD